MIIPFDYELARQASLNREIRTVSGKKIKITSWDDEGPYPICGKILLEKEYSDGGLTWTREGKYLRDCDDNWDLVIYEFPVIPFDPELAKEALDLGIGEITTRAGRPVIIDEWDCDRYNSLYPIYGHFTDNYSKKDNLCIWTTEGRWRFGEETERDLFIKLYNEL